MANLAINGGPKTIDRPLGRKWPEFGNLEREALNSVLESQIWWRGGYAKPEDSWVGRFESFFARFQDCEYGTACTNGTQAIELALKAIGIKPDQEIYRDYLLTVSQMSDDVNQRRKRESMLRGIVGTLFARKDSQRGFTLEQRRILWNTVAQRKCAKCSRILSWGDFTIDHIDPHSKGGRSRLENAAIMCRPCNSSKGYRRR